MSTSKVVLFSPDNIGKILADFDFRVVQRTEQEKKIRVVVDSEGKDVSCPSCEKRITESHVGTVAHGSRLLFCDNPLCFSTWISKNKL